MLNFEEELKKFKPSLEIEDTEDIIYNQDLDDMSDVLVKLLKEALMQPKFTYQLLKEAKSETDNQRRAR